MRVNNLGCRARLERLEQRRQLSSGGGAADVVRSVASLSEARAGIGATIVDGKALFAGGLLGLSASGAVDIYDSSTNSWGVANLSQPRGGVAAASAGHFALFAGGINSISARSRGVVDIYDASSGRWSTHFLRRAQNSDGLAAASVDDEAIFVGGARLDGTLNRVADVFQGSDGNWSSIKLPHAAFSRVAGVVADEVLLAGAPGHAVDVLNTRTGRWSVTADPSIEVPLAATAVGTKVIFAGRLLSDSGGDLVDIYDIVTGKWSIAHLSQSRTGFSATSVGTKALFAGGYFFDANAQRHESDVVDVYDASTGAWSTTTLSAARDGAAAVTLGDRAMFGGGQGGYLQSGSMVDIFTDTSPSEVLSGDLSGKPGRKTSVTVFNTGDADLTGGYSVNVYASTDRTLSSAMLLGSVTVERGLAAGSSAQMSVSTKLPANLAAGSYHLLAAVADGQGNLTPIAAEDAVFKVRAGGKVRAAEQHGRSAANDGAGGAVTGLGRAAARWA
jgi:hypothetical protein